MMRRYVSLWLPTWPTDRHKRLFPELRDRPLVLTATDSGGPRLTAVDCRAAEQGLRSGLRLADASALLPGLQAAEANPAGDAAALAELADWSTRYTPFAAPDGADGLCLDITGCAHLLGGEGALIADLEVRLGKSRVMARAAAANTPAAAWAWARFGKGATACDLAQLPVEALRLDEETTRELRRLGLKRIDDLQALPRAPLAKRFDNVLQRLDLIYGRTAEPISPRRPPPLWRVRWSFPEGLSQREDIDRALAQLLGELCGTLEESGQGARRLELAFYRVDGTARFLAIGTSGATRNAKHLERLFREQLDGVDPGFGIETMILGAVETASLAAQQLGLLPEERQREAAAFSELVDRLSSRLGQGRVIRLAPVASHLPERATKAMKPFSPADAEAWPAHLRRPVRLLPRPEPVEAMAEVPDGPPLSFRWRRVHHRIVRAEGPERVAPEWWRKSRTPRLRDYYCVEDAEGRRFWVYRDGRYSDQAPPRWYMHGLFA